MKFFIDTADTKEIREAQTMGLIDGVTTNPSLVAKTGRSFDEVLKEICEIVDGPISAEVVSTETEGMLEEGRKLAKYGEQVVIKVPLTPAGLAATRSFSQEGIKTNVTLCFSPLQGLLAAKAGATYISPFIGRLDDISHVGMDAVTQLLQIYENYGFHTQVLAASIRHPVHILEAALAGAHVSTIPYKVLMQLVKHPLTDAGLAKFLDDWKKVPQ